MADTVNKEDKKQDGTSGDAPELWGALKGSVQVAPGVDLTAPTGEVWDACEGEDGRDTPGQPLPGGRGAEGNH